MSYVARRRYAVADVEIPPGRSFCRSKRRWPFFAGSIFTPARTWSAAEFVRVTLPDSAVLHLSPGHYVYTYFGGLIAAGNNAAGNHLANANERKFCVEGVARVLSVVCTPQMQRPVSSFYRAYG